jgi:hypothetical protein
MEDLIPTMQSIWWWSFWGGAVTEGGKVGWTVKPRRGLYRRRSMISLRSSVEVAMAWKRGFRGGAKRVLMSRRGRARRGHAAGSRRSWPCIWRHTCHIA